ncbi:carboxypeptidase-like regulatory domain-containing protein [Candidatus Bacteroides intestinigallinarum]|uniref:carboxypeptidase-like regulatory domain-containing protein n=1 Tax=Candidatus Bacteroides intestinigallinarum TaxID=2838470 RepID=UPI00216509AB|nr:carboxypeptidase-like regulatory domain-containing protein [Candidatus Bacteroides intestinigallinarum]MCS3198874.1 carboxypeptidase-like regulatory domain-containing protein [Candidatus Bacteroides intestinigallinarum]
MLKFNRRSIYYVICYLFVNLWFPNAFSEDSMGTTWIGNSGVRTGEVSLDVLQQEKRNIKGTVRDEAGEPLIGVSITVSNAMTGTITDANGNYSILITERGG